MAGCGSGSKKKKTTTGSKKKKQCRYQDSFELLTKQGQNTLGYFGFLFSKLRPERKPYIRQAQPCFHRFKAAKRHAADDVGRLV